MLLNEHKIPASSIAEVVIAMAAIASCIAVAAIVFSRSLMVTNDFETVRKQTEIQSAVWEYYQTHEQLPDLEDITVEKESEDARSEVEIVRWKQNEKVLWMQQILRDDE